MRPEHYATIKEALDRLEDLTEWENEFILSLADMDEDSFLYPKQEEKLEQIQEKLDGN